MRLCFFGKPNSPQLRRVVRGLAARGHDIHVVYRGSGSVPGATYERFAIPPAGLRNPHRWDARRTGYLQRFLDDFDVVSIQFLHSWGFSKEMMQAGCFTVRPWGSDIHPPPDGPQPPAETIVRRREMLQHATAVAATCTPFAEAIAKYGDIPPQDISITRLGVDLREFQPHAAPTGPPVVGFLKGFGYAYGALGLVRALPRIVAAHPRVVCELVGDGPLLAACHHLADSLGVMHSVRWLPRLAPADVPNVLARWSVSVIPSITESFGIAALESSAMRVPVVATAIGGLRETVVDEVTGLLVPPSDHGALADAVVRVLDDAALRKDLGAAGRTFVAQGYAWEKCMDAWERFFEAASASAPRMAGV